MATDAWPLEKATIGEGDELPNSLAARILDIQAAVGGAGASHLPLFTGVIWYADVAQADDTGDGASPETAKKTIGAALALTSAGDAVTVKAGTYDEAGLDLNLDGLELWCEVGVILADSTPGTVLTVSGDACRVVGAHAVQAGAIGFLITGVGTILENCIAIACTIGFDLNEHSSQLFNCIGAACTVTQFDIGERNTILRNCFAPGINGNTRGFYLSSAVVTRCLLDNCHSVGNATSGFEMVAGTANNVAAFSTSGGGDGPTIDAGMDNNWPGYVDMLATEQHEDIYPLSAGQGAAGDPITVNNSTTDGAGGARDDQNYWGDIVRVIPPDTIAIRWLSVGIYIHAVTTADIQQWEILFTYPDYASAQNGGNDWDENEVVLTVVDGSIFQNNDIVWIAGTDIPDGEIMIVSGAPAGNAVTLVRETTADGEAGLRYNHDVAPGNNMMCLVKRETDMEFHGFEGDYSAGSSRDHERYNWHHAKQLPLNSGMLMRMLNASDALGSSFEVRAIYED